jgi:hypothetical protein
MSISMANVREAAPGVEPAVAILVHLGLSAAPTVPRDRSPHQDELSSWMDGGAAE